MVHFGQSPRHTYLHHGHMAVGGSSLDHLAGVAGLLGALPLPGHRFQGLPDFEVSDIMDEFHICIR